MKIDPVNDGLSCSNSLKILMDLLHFKGINLNSLKDYSFITSKSEIWSYFKGLLIKQTQVLKKEETLIFTKTKQEENTKEEKSPSILTSKN